MQTTNDVMQNTIAVSVTNEFMPILILISVITLMRFIRFKVLFYRLLSSFFQQLVKSFSYTACRPVSVNIFFSLAANFRWYCLFTSIIYFGVNKHDADDDDDDDDDDDSYYRRQYWEVAYRVPHWDHAPFSCLLLPPKRA